MTSLRSKLSRVGQRGMSLVEVALAMAIMGIAATASWQAIQVNWKRQEQADTRAHMERAEAAVLAFLAVRGRMPCPAALANGIETCDERLSGHFPFRTVGVPDIKTARLTYSIPKEVVKPWGRFQVLMNDQAISHQSSPRVQAMPFKNVALPNHEGLLDMCEAVSHLSRVRASVFTLVEDAKEGPKSDAQGSHATRSVRAARVSEALACAPMVTVRGRTPYNVHLAAVTLNKTLKDYKWIFESDYGTYALDLAEGMFFTGTRLWGEARRWPKTNQAMSALAEARWVSPNGWRVQGSALANQAATLVSLGAQISNVVRFSINLRAARERYKIVKDLERRGKDIDDLAWQHAILLSSSSAYFLREQQRAPAPPMSPEMVAIEGPGAHALAMLSTASSRATSAGLSPLLGNLGSFPVYTEADRDISIDLPADPGPSDI